MASQSLVSLENGIAEVRELQAASPRQTGSAPGALTLTRAVGRASVVILSSHLEGYIDSLNLEAASVVNGAGVQAMQLPEPLRLLHSKPTIEALSGTSWEGQPRVRLLSDFVSTEGWLWGSGGTGLLDPDRLLIWMKSPSPKALLRYFRYWGIDDIFGRITRAQHTRDDLWRRLKELVDKRNSIAHGDLATSATSADLREYLHAVETFASRSDAALARQLSILCATTPPW
jgi:hypothetical protein